MNTPEELGPRQSDHFPHLTIFARARNREHAYRLLGLGIKNVIRETFAASVEMTESVLEELGLPHEQAHSTMQRFREVDETARAREEQLLRPGRLRPGAAMHDRGQGHHRSVRMQGQGPREPVQCPDTCLTDCQKNFDGCIADGTTSTNPSCCCSCTLLLQTPTVCACQKSCCPNFPQCKPPGTQVQNLGACCSCMINGPGLSGTCL